MAPKVKKTTKEETTTSIKEKTIKKSIKKSKSPKNSVVSGQLAKSIKNKRILRNTKIRKRRPSCGIVFIKNLPRGFYEKQIEEYFQQFGRVNRVRLARSRLSGGTRNFAYIQFQIPEVAKVAAETMNNYLMFHKLVKATYIPPEEQKYNYFRTTLRKVVGDDGKEKFTSRKIRTIDRICKKANEWTVEKYEERVKGQVKKIAKLKKFYSDSGFNFDDVIYNPKKAAAN